MSVYLKLSFVSCSTVVEFSRKQNAILKIHCGLIHFPTSSELPVMTRALSLFLLNALSSKCASVRLLTGLKVWISCERDTRRELLAMHSAVSSLSPVNIQTWKHTQLINTVCVTIKINPLECFFGM